MKFFVGAAAYGVGLLALGCGDISGTESRDVSVTTDKSSYEAAHVSGTGMYGTYGFNVVARIQNTGQRSIYLGTCYPNDTNPMFFVVTDDGNTGSRSAYNPNWGCVGHDQQIVVAPGIAREFTIFIRGPNGWDNSGQFMGTLTGTMRIGFAMSVCSGEGNCSEVMPNASRLSNLFDVQLAK